MSSTQQLSVGSLYRYPVKSMLGETVDALDVDDRGARGDRQWALVDDVTGRVASAKQARLWRTLLTCSARLDDGRVLISLPDGSTVTAGEDGVDDVLSEFLARRVRMADSREEGASLERADPDQVLDRGVDAEVDAPLHVITTATLNHIGIEAQRYRPNVVIDTPPGYPPYAENEWTGRTLVLGSARLTALGPTPRCVVPTLEHGRLGRAPQALRTPAVENRVQSFDFGELPCAGSYVAVAVPGTLRVGTPFTVD